VGRFANGPLTAAVAWALTTILIGINAYLLIALML
jgi:hypothetical protein